MSEQAIDQLSPEFVAAYAQWLGVTDGEAYDLLKAEPLVDITDEPVQAAGWDEAEHPRYPEGDPRGGQFRPKGEPASGMTEREQKEDLDAQLRAYHDGTIISVTGGPNPGRWIKRTFGGVERWYEYPENPSDPNLAALTPVEFYGGEVEVETSGAPPDPATAIGSARDPEWTGPELRPGTANWGGQQFDALEHSEAVWNGEAIGYMGYDIDPDYWIPEATEPAYRAQVSEAFKQAMEDGVPSISTPEDGVLDELLDSGRFKSQFETMSSGGAFNPDARAAQEEMFFGYPQDMPPEERPIYGWVDHPNNPEQAYRLPRQYGAMTWRLKDDIKNRATVTAVDSLSRPVVPGPWRDPGWRAALPAGYSDSGLATYVISDPVYDQGLHEDVMEAQYHGGVTLDDVRAVDVVVNEGFDPVGTSGPPDYGVLTPEQYDRLRKRGIEVNFITEHGGKIDYTPGKLKPGGGTT